MADRLFSDYFPTDFRLISEYFDAQSDEEPISYYRVIHEMNQNLDLPNSIVTHDAGAPRYVFTLVLH